MEVCRLIPLFIHSIHPSYKKLHFHLYILNYSCIHSSITCNSPVKQFTAHLYVATENGGGTCFDIEHQVEVKRFQSDRIAANLALQNSIGRYQACENQLQKIRALRIATMIIMKQHVTNRFAFFYLTINF